jgi:hypothetical protein
MSAYIDNILLRAKVGSSPFIPPGESTPFPGVYLTTAFQLAGTYNATTSLRSRLALKHSDYSSWESHHVLEVHDLDRLGISLLFPARGMQFCVLMPYSAHQKRVNSVLRAENPVKYEAHPKELLRAYCEAYALIGNYTGGGESEIRNELVAIVKALFESAGIPSDNNGA